MSDPKPNQVPIRPQSRDAVYSIIDGERDYQNGGEGNAATHADDKRPSNALTFEGGILCLEQILAEARANWYKGVVGRDLAKPFIRKAAGVAVQLLENFGAPPREGHVPNVAGANVPEAH